MHSVGTLDVEMRAKIERWMDPMDIEGIDGGGSFETKIPSMNFDPRGKEKRRHREI